MKFLNIDNFGCFFRKPDLNRDSIENGSVTLDNRFIETEDAQIKCGQQLDNRIVGGEICEIDKFFILNINFA